MTAMEEMGKVGGDGVDVTLLTGKRMIDFNWIDEEQLLAGCSGDVSCRIRIDPEWETPAVGHSTLAVSIRGLKGGHCEFDIHFDRANHHRSDRQAAEGGDAGGRSPGGDGFRWCPEQRHSRRWGSAPLGET